MDCVQFYKCLADNTRLKLLLLIQQHQELCVCELTTALALSQPKVSRHLAQLRQCGLLKDRRQGIWIFYQINPQLNQWAQQIIELTLVQNASFIDEDNLRLKQMGARSEIRQNCC